MRVDWRAAEKVGKKDTMTVEKKAVSMVVRLVATRGHLKVAQRAVMKDEKKVDLTVVATVEKTVA